MRPTNVLARAAVDVWKATLAPQRVAAWQAHDASLHRFLRASIPEALEHTGEAAFDEHLVGVQTVLRVFGADDDVCDAGLFHSIYGTEGFQGYKLPMAKRPEIRRLLGPRAERLVWMFCVLDRAAFDKTLFASSTPTALVARPELGRFDIPLASTAEYHDLMELVLADWMDQVEGAAARANPLFERWESTSRLCAGPGARRSKTLCAAFTSESRRRRATWCKP
ncbi:hypothetical protein SDRG_10478 [Saprolegnia diclina VS20]|uniref:DUF6817 domain-containing protein n=1 Tax=Saprolegnia diclina (strain VS20) TaxID=1156394 RepID=T0Q2D0_SAPDV|nr:hypothetical protein SDRG_10478 [Saprolegnia diclina VS20]EQC31964.1 hypothetical protein SDRG_10478 [Saprolegnia diclina VS20]|eukprot:XP_008614692.1 hypothetical protein SDRG_10478 [Saprolegnia diclina VS20]